MYYRRQSRRLYGYDYTTKGSFYVTIRVHDGEKLFGYMLDKSLHLNDAGRMINKWWLNTQSKYKSILLDKYVIMPNHIHGVINMLGPSKTDLSKFNIELQGEHIGSPLQLPNPSLSRIIQWFKTMTTNDYINQVKINEWKRFEGKLWQRNYYEHIIRNEQELYRIRKYITNNPINWKG